MVIGFASLEFWAIKCLRVRDKGIVCIRVRFGLGLFFLILRIIVVLYDNWCFFIDRALVDWMILVWIQ